MKSKPALVLTVSVVAAAGVLLVRAVQNGRGDHASVSAPRLAWGEPDLTGVWKGQKLGATPDQDAFNLTQLEVLYRPEGRAKMTQMSGDADPTLRCFPPSFPHAMALGWPIQIVQTPGMMFVFTEAFHTFRNVPTDRRPHLSEDLLAPMFMGDSTGHWEGDTLVVDVVSFNGETWLAGGQDKPTKTSTGVWRTSDAMHVVERWRRVDAETVEYQARVEDPNMLTGAWDTPTIVFTLEPVDTIQEVKCLVDDPGAPAPVYLEQFGR